jgi:hypothetical protein
MFGGHPVGQHGGGATRPGGNQRDILHLAMPRLGDAGVLRLR